ncbi:MAG: type VI secretion system tip protein TssI/VgrG [Acidobacteriota bacterium]|nr:type VI secretion system tip protein TssI/VgrG [Acidobacteriota bacterium]
MSAVKHNVADIIWKSPGADIQPLSLRMQQALSDLYTIDVEVKCPDDNLKFTDMLQARAVITLKCGEELEDDRTLSGIITRFSQGRTRHGNLPNASKQSYVYHVEIRPKLWLLTRGTNTRVFQDKTAKDIVEEVVNAYGITMEWQVNGSPPTRTYCVQYRESDYNFISRLLEDEGICFFFDQENDKVIFSDHPGGHPDCIPVADATYVEEISARMAFGKQEFISDFTYEETVGAGKLSQQHYNYETSQTNISAEATETEVPNYDSLEQYDHTQNYKDKSEGQRYADLRKEEMTAWSKNGWGVASCRSFEAGYCFTMKDHFRDELNVKWLLTSLEISAEQGVYQCRFAAQPVEVPFRPVRRTPRPKIAGLQTATITGPSGSEVYLDDMGRCKLQFHWDREGSMNERSSMWVRVANNYAGKDYGIQWIPRVGHDVVVTFIDGDPDLPLVTGRVYNDFNTAPLGPAKKYQNIIKTIKDHHIIFDDTDGSEMLDIRSQKDMTTLVMNDQSATIKNDRSVTVENNQTVNISVDNTESVGSNQSISVGSNQSVSVGANESYSVGANQDVSIKGKQETQIGGSETHTVLGSKTETVNGNHSMTVNSSETQTVASSQTVSVGTSQSVTVGADQTNTVGSNQTVNVGAKQTTTVGAAVSTSAGATITMNAGTNLTLSCGGSTITMSPGSIALSCGGSSVVLTPGVTMVTSPILKLN